MAEDAEDSEETTADAHVKSRYEKIWIGTFIATAVVHTIHGLALLIIPALGLYGKIFGNTWLPVFAVVAVVMMPRFCGHCFNNSKDLPFAVATAWYMYATACLFNFPRLDGYFTSEMRVTLSVKRFPT